MSFNRLVATWAVAACVSAACAGAATGGPESGDATKSSHDAAATGDAADARVDHDASVHHDANARGDTGAHDDATAHPDAIPPSGDASRKGDAGDASDASALADSAIACDSSVTWTALFNAIFGPSGTSSCTGAQCHSSGQAGFVCATPAAACYHGMVAFGLVTPGPSAPSSVLVDPQTSPLCGVSPGGDMPEVPPPIEFCVTDAQVSDIEAWLGCGAPMN